MLGLFPIHLVGCYRELVALFNNINAKDTFLLQACILCIVLCKLFDLPNALSINFVILFSITTIHLLIIV